MITTRDELINSLANRSTEIRGEKTSLHGLAAAGQIFSLWTGPGTPVAGAAPGAATVPTNATTGAMTFPNQTPPDTSYGVP